MTREIGKHGAALFDAGVGIALVEHDLLARFMQAFDENELAAMVRLAETDPGPTGQDIGETRDVRLRITGADTERMQFENLTRQIFIQALVAVDAGNGVRAHRRRVVQIEQHRGMAFDRDQHVGETAKDMRPDRFALISAGHRNDLVGRNAEMVRPEPHKPFDKADLGADRGLEAHFGFVLDQLTGQLRLRDCRFWGCSVGAPAFGAIVFSPSGEPIAC